MDDLRFQIEWLEADGVAGPEFQATWCRLQVLLNGNDLFRLYDEKTGSVRNGLYIPAYVFAEWLADRYHFLLQEYPRSTVREPEYSYRHDLLYNREGYLLPELNIYPSDQRTITIDVSPVSYEYERKKFLAEEHHICDRSSFEAGVRRFINAVTERLEDCGIGETYLSRRWQELTDSDPEERLFIEVTSALGKHFAELTEDEVREFLDVSRDVPEEIIREFAPHLTFTEYLQQFGLLSRLTLEMQSSAGRELRLQEIRSELLVTAQRSHIPWVYGYTLARTLRTMLKAQARTFESVEDIHHLIGLESSLLSLSPTFSDVHSALNAVIVSPTKDRVNLALRENVRATSRIFSYCRALGEYFTMGEKKVSVVSSKESWGQQRNRAFAAEFLVPVQLLQERIAESSVHAEQIDALAEEFHVSSRLIRHQLGNQTSIVVIEED